ncbi:MAG TPA: hypothetical protein VKM55_00890 [Candidatus Lokiarchaeia archaeon]|nr:hypothetical protein [Candidatus Lokiarchaeia archaeon]
MDETTHLGERSTPDKKFNIKLPEPPPLPPSVDEIRKSKSSSLKSAPPDFPSKKSASTSRGNLTPPPEPPGERPAVAGFTPLPVPPSLIPTVDDGYEVASTGDAVQLQQELQQARNELAEKAEELASIEASFNEIKDQLARVGDLISSKDGEIEGLRSTNELLLAETKNKDNSLVRSKAKVDLLEETATKAKREASEYKQRCEEIEQEKATLEENLVTLQQERDEMQAKLDDTSQNMGGEVETLRTEKFQINDRLTKRMEEVASLEQKVAELNEEIAQLKGDMEAKNLEMSNTEARATSEKNRIVTGRDNIIALFNELLDGALHNVMIVVPSMVDVKEIDLSKLKASVKTMISTKVDMTSQDDLDLVQALSDLNGVEVRSYDNSGRFAINVDRGDVAIGVDSTAGAFALHTQDPQAIDLFVKQFMLECWTLGRTLNKR